MSHRGMTSKEQIAHLKAENAALREQVQTLLEHVQELEGRLAKDRQSSGSGAGANEGRLDEEIIQQRLIVTHRFEMQDARYYAHPLHAADGIALDGLRRDGGWRPPRARAFAHPTTLATVARDDILAAFPG